MATKKITPVSPTKAVEDKTTEDAKATERKTASLSGRVRKTARKTNTAGCRF